MKARLCLSAYVLNQAADTHIEANPIIKFADRHGVTADPQKRIVGRVGEDVGYSLLPSGGLRGVAGSGISRAALVLREALEAAASSLRTFLAGDWHPYGWA